MWLPGAGVGGEDLAAKDAKGAKKRRLTTKARSSRRVRISMLLNFATSFENTGHEDGL
jgi:hypothetical protein